MLESCDTPPVVVLNANESVSVTREKDKQSLLVESALDTDDLLGVENADDSPPV